MKPEEQNGFALDPSVTFWSDHAWQWRWTLAMENLGSVTRSIETLPYEPRFGTGVGMAIPLGLGLLEMGVDAWAPRTRSVELNDLSLGGNYSLGALQFLAGVNAERVTGGVRFALRNIDLGVSYTTTQWPSGDSENYQQSLMTQVGLGF
jgi:hypothetical protein